MTKSAYDKIESYFNSHKKLLTAFKFVNKALTPFVFVSYFALLGYLLFVFGILDKRLQYAVIIPAFTFLSVSIFRRIFNNKRPYEEIEFNPPKFKLALAQVIVGSADILMASLVLYSILEHFMDIPFITFIGTFIIAQVLGVYSQVPGGLGVFEVMFSNLLPDDDANQATIFAILVLYRIIYYLLPLIISGIALFVYEISLARRRKRLASQSK